MPNSAAARAVSPGAHKLCLLIAVLCLSLGCSSADEDSDGWTAEEGDCNDLDSSVNPGKSESCDGFDQNCDGQIDEGLLVVLFQDLDHDGYGSAATMQGCSSQAGYTPLGGDCNDNNATIYPSATELCDTFDNDCDEQIDEEVTQLFYIDADQDGYGSTATAEACVPSNGLSTNDDDCDDGESQVFPGAVEVCDAKDNDCDNMVDDGAESRCYQDGDGDGFGNDAVYLSACSCPEGYSAMGGDCDDADEAYSPGVAEHYNQRDDDCDGSVDEGLVAPMVAAGEYHFCALTEIGLVYCWGNNDYGQLGNGSTVSSSVPVQVNTIDQIVAISAGDNTGFALRADGTLWAWGDNSYDQLGDGTNTNHATPVQVPELSDVISISTREFNTLALKSDGSVWGWGYNQWGELSDFGDYSIESPTLIEDFTNIIQVSMGVSFSLALRVDGTVLGRGYNDDGELGYYTGAYSDSAVEAEGLEGVVQISAGDAHSLALLDDGTVMGWGSNSAGQLNYDDYLAYVPVVVTGLQGVYSVTAGSENTFAVLAGDGTVLSMGYNFQGILGNGSHDNQSTLGPVVGLSGMVQVVAYGRHSLAQGADGSVWAWGSNDQGELGTGSEESVVYVPERVLMPE